MVVRILYCEMTTLAMHYSIMNTCMRKNVGYWILVQSCLDSSMSVTSVLKNLPSKKVIHLENTVI